MTEAASGVILSSLYGDAYLARNPLRTPSLASNRYECLAKDELGKAKNCFPALSVQPYPLNFAVIFENPSRDRDSKEGSRSFKKGVHIPSSSSSN